MTRRTDVLRYAAALLQHVLLPGLLIGAAGLVVTRLYEARVPVPIGLLAGFAVAAMLALGRSLPADDPGAAVAEARTDEQHSTLGDYTVLQARLDACSRDDERFESRLRPDLRRLVAERLRQRHGMDWLAEPQRARAVLGNELWSLLTAPSGTLRGSRAQLERWVAEMERL